MVAMLRVPSRDVAALFDCSQAKLKLLPANFARLLNNPNDDGAISLTDYFSLTRAFALLALEESLGLAPRPLVAGTTDFVMAQAALGKTLDDAMRHVARAYNKLHGGGYNSIELNDGMLTYAVDDSAFPYTRPADSAVTLMLECVLISLHGAFCAVIGEDLSPHLVRVATRRRETADHDANAFWSCPVERGAPAYAISYAVALARRPVEAPVQRLTEQAIHNRTLALIAKREAALSAGPQFTRQIVELLREGVFEQDEAAARLGLSVATLRRHLSREGHSFRTLRRLHLNEAAKLRLMQGPRIADIADDLGFSDPRSFTRAFKGWNGASPSAYRSAIKLRS